MKVIITFTSCFVYSLWLWKSLENSRNFFLLFFGHPVWSFVKLRKPRLVTFLFLKLIVDDGDILVTGSF